jgi:hypothetical protein
MNGAALPPPSIAKALTPQEEAAQRADCSCPRGGGWRPGARWAENSKERNLLVALKKRMAAETRAVHQEIEQLPPTSARRCASSAAAPTQRRWCSGIPLPQAGEGKAPQAPRVTLSRKRER